MSIAKISAGTFSPDISVTTIFCDTSKGEINIILPNIQDSQLDRKEDYEFFIIDTSDNASNNNIVLTGSNSNGQQVNSKDRIILSQDGVVASLKPASYLNWVCNVSSLEAQQVSGLSNIGKTNCINYTTPSSELQMLRGVIPQLPYVLFDKKLYNGLSFFANVGSDYFFYVQRLKFEKGASVREALEEAPEPSEGTPLLLFKRTSETSMEVVAILTTL